MVLKEVVTAASQDTETIVTVAVPLNVLAVTEDLEEPPQMIP